ncbi:hypothetical protein ACFFHF_12115 [Robertmurraya beringensis]|uniref:Uncharacterized protein n=1 Tax=Robertmurraya beringensis TaxID=641660 RepID=A0ABV6KRN4_9BACI
MAVRIQGLFGLDWMLSTLGCPNPGAIRTEPDAFESSLSES